MAEQKNTIARSEIRQELETYDHGQMSENSLVFFQAFNLFL